MKTVAKSSLSSSPAKGEVERVVAHLQGLNLRFDFESPAEHCYTSPTLILCDAVLSIHRKYKEFVQPRIELLKQKSIDQKSLSELVELIGSKGEMAFTSVWDYDYLDRVKTLRNLAHRFLNMNQASGLTSDLEFLREWGRISVVGDFDGFKVPGIGLASFQYLRILCGAETVKPDVHLRQAAGDGLGLRVSDDKKVIALLEAASRIMNVSAKRLDYAIWDHYSKISRGSKKCA